MIRYMVMGFATIATYIIIFFGVYVQLFFLVTFFEKKKEIVAAPKEKIKLSDFPKVGVIIPCWNEEATIHGTIDSLLALDYPPEKIELIVVDDGSTDTTWNEILKYKDYPQIKIFHKENGGKHTAVNFGMDQTDARFISCLDADSFVAPDALLRIMHTFEKHPDVMAVAPSIIIDKPKNLVQMIQKVEYNMSLYNKKMLSFLNAIHVTPGPFSVFRREVFEKIGKFRKAHNTEDAEIAFRMQTNHMKIEHCHLAQVYTVAPDTVRKLFRQRLRWIYGFIQNVIDYRRVIFRKEYGNFGLFTIPGGLISITTVIYIFLTLVYHLGVVVVHKIVQLRTVGFRFTFMNPFHFNLFYTDTKTIAIVTIVLYSFLLFSIVWGNRLAKEKHPFNRHIISYMLIYTILAPIWLIHAVWNTITANKPSWR